MCGIQFNLLSKKILKNSTFYSAGNGSLYRLRLGSGCKPFLFEKCRPTHTVFLEEHLTLFSQVTTCPNNFADLFNNSHVAGFKNIIPLDLKGCLPLLK